MILCYDLSGNALLVEAERSMNWHQKHSKHSKSHKSTFIAVSTQPELKEHSKSYERQQEL
jgi:hypothetical protein